MEGVGDRVAICACGTDGLRLDLGGDVAGNDLLDQLGNLGRGSCEYRHLPYRGSSPVFDPPSPENVAAQRQLGPPRRSVNIGVSSNLSFILASRAAPAMLSLNII